MHVIWLVAAVLLVVVGITVCVVLLSQHEDSGTEIQIDDQPASSMQVINKTSEQPLYVYLGYSNVSGLDAPPNQWEIVSWDGGSGEPVVRDPEYSAYDVGAGYWQVLELSVGAAAVLKIPDFVEGQAFTIRPLKKRDGAMCEGASGDCGMPIIIENGKGMVGDFSAVDGLNFICKYEMSTSEGNVTIDLIGNPCRALGLNENGCRNPFVDGDFIEGTTWESEPCHAGTCNLIGDSKTWCDIIHTGQCANSESIWSGGYFAGCGDTNEYTTYCYSHDDQNSQPWFSPPYKMRITYRDLSVGV
jgi:hypothetical protein